MPVNRTPYMNNIRKKNDEEQRRRISYENGYRAPLRQPSPTPVWDNYVKSTRVNIMPEWKKAPVQNSVLRPKVQPRPATPVWDKYVKSTQIKVLPDWKKVPKQNMVMRPQTPKTLTPTWDKYVEGTKVNIMPNWKRVEQAPRLVRPAPTTYDVKGGTVLNRPKIAVRKIPSTPATMPERKIDGSKLTPMMKDVMKTYELGRVPVRGNIVVNSATGTREYKTTQKTKEILDAYS